MFEKSVFNNLKSVRDKARRAMNLAFDDKKQSGAMISDVLNELNRTWDQVVFARSKMDNAWNDIKIELI